MSGACSAPPGACTRSFTITAGACPQAPGQRASVRVNKPSSGAVLSRVRAGRSEGPRPHVHDADPACALDREARVIARPGNPDPGERQHRWPQVNGADQFLFDASWLQASGPSDNHGYADARIVGPALAPRQRAVIAPVKDDGIISQFEGYDKLEEFNWEGYRKKYGNIQRLDRILEAEGDTPQPLQAVQAD